jgi:plastocyanin domain-containing protein
MVVLPRVGRRLGRSPRVRRMVGRLRRQSMIDRVLAWVEEEQPDLAGATAPDGTVTILFTDIENSTALNERPDLIRVRQGVPLRLVFDRKESGDCTERVVFPDFRVSKRLPAFQRTAVELLPECSGRFAFACGMNMVHGELLVEPPTANGEPPVTASVPSGHEAAAEGARPRGRSCRRRRSADRGRRV